MLPSRRVSVRPVSKSGAHASQILRGLGKNNWGLRLWVLGQQARGSDGPIQGRFQILDVGENPHSYTLATLLHRTTDAEEVLRLIRRERRSSVNVVNANILGVEEFPNPTG
jgi:hypothetical protein